ncbi:MAG: Cell division protein FtsZ, partial [uncultured Solirubrobacterales bacterium]
FEVNEAAEIIQSAADRNSNIIFGAVINEDLEDEVRVTVIATGFDGGGPPPPPVPRFDVEQRDRDRDRSQPRAPRREEPSRGRGPIFDQSESSSLEIGDDDIDVPPFLKDT